MTDAPSPKVAPSRSRYADLAVAALLFLLPLILFWPQTIGGRTLLPGENLYQYPPYSADRAALGVPLPHNALLSDLVLQNFHWKSFIREALAEGEIPLWNPHQFSGIPFLAAGQQSTLYPLSALYYVLPLTAAYGWFTVIQLWIAGLALFALARGLGISRTGAAIGAVTYQLAGFFVVSAVFPMIIAGGSWLPLILLASEAIIADRPVRGRSARPLWLIGGAAALGLSALAGHVEIVYYTLLIAGAYAAIRLLSLIATRRALRPEIAPALYLIGMVALGLALGAVQFLPLFNFASINFRTGSATMDDIRAWAHPARDLVLFLMPNFYGSPAHHSYFDVFTLTTVPASVNALGEPIYTIDWGIKNYVEGAVYVGILPLILAAFGLILGRRADRIYRFTFAGIGLVALTFMFGLPTYALLLNTLPGFNQLHSPFRWIFALTACIAVLAGFGWDALALHPRAARRAGIALLIAGGLIAAGALISRLIYPSIEPLLTRLLTTLALADRAFADARMFYSYLLPQVVLLGLMVLGGGAVLALAAPGSERAAPGLFHRVKRGAGALAVGLLALDLLIAWWGFNPASDPAWLDYTPPSIRWLQAQGGHWRYTTFVDPTQADPDVFNANLTQRYGLDDIRGYESIIPRQYVEYMRRIAPQVQTDFNRVAPIYSVYPDGIEADPIAALTSPYLDLLNVRYVIAQPTTDLSGVPGYALAYEDAAVRIWENTDHFPRAFFIPGSGPEDTAIPALDAIAPVGLVDLNSRERLLTVDAAAAGRLILSETFTPGWRGFIRPADSSPEAEAPLDLELAYDNFISATIPAGSWIVRLIYSPQDFQIGLFASFIAGLILILTGGAWLWRALIGGVEQASGIGRVARNSIAPIVLNLFNRGIDFAFAFVMLRVLGPESAGAYFYAGVIFMWFDILTNFGLNLYLTREVARDRSRAAALFVNTTALRLLLLIAGVPILIGFIAARQATVTPPLDEATLTAIGLLYVGLIPGTISTGLTALFYAFERAELPALIATVATILKAVFGLAALLIGAEIVGLAGASIITNTITLVLLAGSGVALLTGLRRQRVDVGLVQRMVGGSWPLMLNHLLATIFFQIDVIIIEIYHGARMVGQYSVAYKWLSALNVIPAFFTQAMLPRMSQMAHGDRDGLRRMYGLAIKLLFSLALPTAVIVTFAAYALVTLLGGAEYLPDSAIATQLMIWSIPIGWMNSFTQYVLIAQDQQRRITGAFIIAVTFNLVTNFLFIPRYGYSAAAITTILSEAVLFVPFVLLAQGGPHGFGRVRWIALLWKPAAAGAVMFGITLALWPVAPLIALAAGAVVYGALWIALGVLDPDERAKLLPLLPGPLRRLARQPEPARPCA